MRRAPLALLLLTFLVSCAHVPAAGPEPYVIVLGIAQDGGYPQAGCRRADCVGAWKDPSQRRMVASLGIVDPRSGKRWMIDATPDFARQLDLLNRSTHAPIDAPPVDGIFITHAHIGHYTGLMHLGREVLGSRNVPVYTMPRMAEFLENNGPWSQLVKLRNIDIVRLAENVEVPLGESLSIRPIVVPHRDEFSETVGYVIRGPHRSILWLPDIDKWDRWKQNLEEVLRSVDVAFIDGTFYRPDELPGRDMSEVPHPFVVETIDRIDRSDPSLRARIRFMHLNQSNLLLRSPSAIRALQARGYKVASEGQRESL